MAISNFSFVSMAAQLGQEQGISFQDKALTWDTAADVQDVVDALNKQTTVHYLNLDGNTLGVEAAQAIGEGLKRHPEFRKALWKNLFTRRLKSEIPDALKHLGAALNVAGAKLTVLDLSDNALGPNGMRGLEEFLRSPVCYSLQELLLYNCGLGPEGGSMLSKALIDLHANAKKAGTPLQLRIFVGARNRLENAGAISLAAAFKTLKTFEEIVLQQNSIYIDGVEVLAEAFKENPHLRVLNMNDNTLRSAGAEKIAEILPFLPMLRELNFGDCLIRTNGAYHFGEALENSNDQLEVVDLGFNEINSDGGMVLVNAMRNKPKLRFLNLDGNCFGEEGAEQIINEMNQLPTAAALQPFEENNSEEEESGEEEEEGDYDEDEDYDEHEHANDTTEEADEDDEEYNTQAEETAYVTTNAYTTKLFNDTNLNASDTFAVTGKTIIQKCTPEEFCLSQTPCSQEQFDSLDQDNKFEALQSIVNQFTGDNHLLLLVFTTLKCAHLSQSSKAALDLAVSLYQATFDYAIKTKQETRVLNYVLMQLRLLRCEEPFKSDYDVKGCRFALREALKQPKFANDNIKNSFKNFLDKVDV
ncbi:ran GTPase-activating protein isoform X1 [Drosophila subpulchrella]|uniref:ran GTPase-activating protein isoform X1 n=2 Tax=Drosophila subpulchrella TaxID=1486046 RepID=UPI0018A13E7A|nr:ran GTPase-activating protein isoform X1 [Drosophila subpulchrella]